ncbi:CHAT domain-containing protein [Blastococcus haudaquaticus]|uniref:CHAT domain-containing protein n=1 Tax=Blastococcus haudaquaticus TaxID=1938745 RepID=A0A286H805_9ACTN|nr:CHAT domain-containing protein [Blastococcus haudaquaticus]SOE03459.1 CHAT domain-containing protein [Blastococcus haudaquaticus]
MSRVVVRVAGVPNEDDAGEQIFLSLEDPPFDIKDFEKLHPFECPSGSLMKLFYEEPPSGENMRAIGEALLGKLGDHPAVATAVQYAFQQNDCCPLYLRLIGSETAAAYPWETLFDAGNGFLALEDRWPIARIAAQIPREKDVRTFTSPLKVMAVMSAIGVPADDEWTALRQALVGAQLKQELEVDVWVGEKTLAERIRSDLATDGLPGTVNLLTEGPELLRDLQRFDPHLLHLFCHGQGGTSPLLKLATRRDHYLREGNSSVVLEPLQLRNRGRSTWLVTLNSCEGGSDSDGARSIAYLLIGAGYPAVIGMRDPVSSADAALFTRSFYGSLLDHLDSHLVNGEEVEIELAASLVTPRRQLRDKYINAHHTPREAAALHRDWTLPVLYVRPDPLRIERVAADPKHSTIDRRNSTDYLNTLMKYRLEAPPDTPPDALRRVDAEIRRALTVLEGGDG